MPGPAQVSGGPIHAVKCPHCGHSMDFRELLTQDGSTIYGGAEISCEACNRISVITKVQAITFIQLRPTNKVAEVAQGQGQHAQQARQLQPAKPGFFQKLLGKG